MNKKENILITTCRDAGRRTRLLIHLSLRFPQFVFSTDGDKLLVRGISHQDTWEYFDAFCAGFEAGWKVREEL